MQVHGERLGKSKKRGWEEGCLEEKQVPVSPTAHAYMGQLREGTKIEVVPTHACHGRD